MATLTIESHFGFLTIEEAEGQIVSLSWGRRPEHGSTPLLQEAARQLRAYSDGSLTAFNLPLSLGQGQRRAFGEALLAIPFGSTRTYGEIGADLGLPAQAVGQLCGQNPIPIIIPCHRVLAANGLGGFSGAHGIESKVALLRHEGAASLLI